MNVTDKTWEDILKYVVLKHGNVGLLVAVGIIAFIVGVILAWLYLSKIKYRVLNNKLEEMKSDKSRTENELKNAKETIAQLREENNALRSEYADITDDLYARHAIADDELDSAVKAFAHSS